MANVTDPGQGILPIVSFYVYTIFSQVNGVFLVNSFSLLGIVSNTANIIVYVKMGLSETANISLLALSTCDLIVSICLLLSINCVNPLLLAITQLPSGASLKEITYAVTSVMYNSLGLGACVTAILSAERCLCVIFPLKVKSIVTARRVKVVIGALVIYETIFAVLILATTGPPFAKFYANRTRFMGLWGIKAANKSSPNIRVLGVAAVTRRLCSNTVPKCGPISWCQPRGLYDRIGGSSRDPTRMRWFRVKINNILRSGINCTKQRL
ncbi:chemosensory receptor A [Elysia marginata]|uniref:Chemosensory receptor A n=1 Tax=Elysia marginata TaxID=1093978 RepID=A0AAV4I1B5_9GAST|nr:chemosensory receptor A [Elysia marginata]